MTPKKREKLSLAGNPTCRFAASHSCGGEPFSKEGVQHDYGSQELKQNGDSSALK